MTDTQNGTKRYSLAIPQRVFDELKSIADEEGLSVVDVMRGCFKIGAIAYRAKGTPDSALVIREGKREKELILL